MIDVKSKIAGRFAIKQIQTATEDDYKRIYDQTLRMFGQAAADKIKDIRNGKV
jgi:hypothetical protein